MLYRMAEESDIESILGLVQSAILEMERQGIFQWDSIYPSRDDFLDDIREEPVLFSAGCVPAAAMPPHVTNAADRNVVTFMCFMEVLLFV